MMLQSTIVTLLLAPREITAFVTSSVLRNKAMTTADKGSSQHKTAMLYATDDISPDEVQQMMDEAMMLYASPSLLHAPDDDIQAFRKREVQDLVKDLMLLQKGGRQEAPEEAEDEDDNDDNVITPTLLKAEPQQSLTDISRELDDAILGGYHPDFSEEEIAQWVKNIDSLSKRMETQLKAIPSHETHVSAITVSAETVPHEPATATPPPHLSTKEQFESRLEQLKVLIDPLDHTPTPLIGSQIVEEEAPVAPVASMEILDDNPETAEGATEKTEVPSTQVEANAVPEGAFFASLSDETDDTVVIDHGTISSSADELAAMALSMEASNVTDTEAADVISAVVSVAAISAAAVTKLPIFVAGVAMAPLVKSSIAYAQGRMTAHTNGADEHVVEATGQSNSTEAHASNATDAGVKRKSELLEPDVLTGWVYNE